MAKTEIKPSTDEDTDFGYTAVVYFHGMGSQRRFEESSRLVDALDEHIGGIGRRRSKEGGKSWMGLSKIRLKFEHSRIIGQGLIRYIRVLFKDGCSDNPRHNTRPDEVRIYEPYWAQHMAQTNTTKNVLTWMFRQVFRPFGTLMTPWRERERLRRASLNELSQIPHKWPKETTSKDFERLIHLYHTFSGLTARRQHRSTISKAYDGIFRKFIAHISTANSGKKEKSKRLIRLAKAWRAHYIRTELRNLFTLFTLAVTIVFFCCIAVYGIYLGLNHISLLDWEFIEKLPTLPIIGDMSKIGWHTAIAVSISLATTLGLAGFLTKYMGDVEAWSTFDETNTKHSKRRAVLDTGIDYLYHVLSDKRCKRAVIISHSLGTSVAHDCLLAAVHYNKSVNSDNPLRGELELTGKGKVKDGIQLNKISHFITIASPIDKINYFFESSRSSIHRYLRIREELRGDIGQAPFMNNTTPHIHWVNFWDEADIISGPLHSAASSKQHKNKVDNVHTQNLYFPSPGKAHSAYFESLKVIQPVADMIFYNKYNYQTVPTNIEKDGKRVPPNYASVLIGSEKGRGSVKIYHTLATALPWVGFTGLVSALFGAEKVLEYSIIAFGTIAIILIMLWLVDLGSGPRDPITPKQS